MAEVHWNKSARMRIAPRTEADLKDVRMWRFTDWAAVAKQLAGSKYRMEEPDLTPALERVLAWDVAPTELMPLETEILLGIIGPNRIVEYLAARYGAESIVPMLVKPSFEANWVGNERVVQRSKAGPNGRLLRMVTVHQNAESRAACKAALQRNWDEGDITIKQQLAFGFPDDEEWRTAALAQVLEFAPPFSSTQLTFVRDVASARAVLAHRKKESIEYVELVASLGAEALPLLLELAPSVRGVDPHVSLTLALTTLVCEDAAHHLASTISHPSTRGHITDYFERHKALAKAALPKASQGASRNAALAKALLLKTCGVSATVGDTVSVDDPAVPEVLRAAPWRTPAIALPNLELDLASWPTRVTLSRAQESDGLAELESTRGSAPEMTPAEVVAYKAANASGLVWRLVIDDKALPLELVLELYCAGRWGGDIHLPMLAKFGVRALPGLRNASALRNLPADVIAGIEDPHLAFLHAHSAIASARSGHSADWKRLFAQPRAAAFGLLAVAHEQAKHDVAEYALRKLARHGHAATILEIAGQTKHEAAVRALLVRDPRKDVLAAPVKVNAHAVARPVLRDGRPLSDEAMTRIYEMVAFSLVDEPYAGIEDVKSACDPNSLAEMAWDLAALADGDGKRSRASRFDDWMRWTVRYFANDAVIRRLTPALKHDTIYAVLQSLAVDGVRSATMEIATAVERGDSTQALKIVATALGVTVDDVVETMLPTTALEAEGTTPLTYGTRELRVGFDTTLAPILFEGEKRLASLPKAKKTDDPIAVRLAKERWEELKEDVRAIARLRCRGLELAMRSRREIPAAKFMAGWATHPLGKHLARGVVWAVPRDGSLVTFRVAEDSSLADVGDDALVLAENEVVRVPHPLELERTVVDQWLRIFGDYNLIQAVQQLGRAPLPLAPEEADAAKIVRPLPHPIPSSVYERITREQGFYYQRPMLRMPGMAQMHQTTQYRDRKYWVESVALEFHEPGNETIPVSKVDPIELAEALFVMRLVLEAPK